jgi:hypothetical protein
VWRRGSEIKKKKNVFGHVFWFGFIVEEFTSN